MTDFDRTLNLIAQCTGKQIEKDINFLRFAGMGGGLSIDGIIEVEKLVFDVKKELNENEGVEIISKIAHQYLKNMYSEIKMKYYLETHEFTYKNLEVNLFIQKENGDDVFHPGIRFFTLRDGIVSYRTITKSDKGFYITQSYVKEPFIEAAKRVGVWYPDVP